MAQNTVAPWGEYVPEAPDMMTADALARLADDGRSYELVEGRLVRMPPTGGGHGRVNMNLSAAMHLFVTSHQLGMVLGAETGFLVSAPDEPDTVLAPDIAFVRAERVPSRESSEWSGYWRLAPDLVVEVVSPSQYGPEMNEKSMRWLQVGVGLVWVIWPEAQRVDIWRPGTADAPIARLTPPALLDAAPMLPGFTFPVANVFL